MKRFLFTMMTLVALVLVANTTFAAEIAPYAGGTYPYVVAGVSVTANGTIDLAYLTGSGATFSSVTDGNDVALTDNGGNNYDYLTTSTAGVKFNVAYSSGATDGTIRLTVNQGSCSNYIDLDITITAPPTWTLTITSDQVGDDYGCQQPLASPSSDGSADAYAGGDNTITYTVATGSAPAGTPTFAYTVGVTGATCSTCGSGKTAAGDFAATFSSTEGAGFNVVGTLSSATFTMDAAHGGGTYDMTLSGSPRTVTVSPLPTIGSFN